MSRIIKWKALQACVAGGAYREAGEIFDAPDTDDYAEDVRMKLGANDDEEDAQPAKAKAGKTQPPKAKAEEAPGVTPEELHPVTS